MHVIVYGAALTAIVEGGPVEFLNFSKLEILFGEMGPPSAVVVG